MNLSFDKRFYKRMLVIAMPIALQNFIYSSLNMIDTFMIVKVGKNELAAVGAANKVFFLLNLILFGICSGAAIFSAQFWGKKDEKSIKKILGLSLILSILASIIFTILALVFPHFVMGIFNKEKEVMAPGVEYLKILGISYLFTAISFTYTNILRSTGKVKLPMVLSIFSVLLNTTLNYILIFGNFGAPELGVNGAAIATTLSRVLECVILLFIIYRNDYVVAAKFIEMFDFSREFVITFFRKTLPVMANEFMWSLGVTIYAVVYGHMGSDALAVTTISQTIEQLAMVLFFGLGSACAVILGNELGASNKERVYKYGKKFLKLGVNIGIIISIILFFISPLIVDIFKGSEGFEGIRSDIIYCNFAFCIFLPFKAFNLINVVGVLRSGGDTVFSLFLDIGGVWLIGIPLVVLGGLIFDLPIYYVYGLSFIEEVVKMFVGLIRFKSKLWVNNIVENVPKGE